MLAEPQALTPVKAATEIPRSNRTESVRPTRLLMRRNLPAIGASRNASENGASQPDLPKTEGSMCRALTWVCGISTVSVTVVALAPAAIEVGEKLEVAPEGNPLSVRAIGDGRVDPSTGFTVNVKVPAAPGCTAAAGVAMEMAKSWTSSEIGLLEAARKFASPP